MIAVDSNILIYAHRSDSPFHRVAARRLSDLAAGDDAWAIPWPCAHEFLAIVTNRRVFEPPTAPDRALEFLDALFEAPTVARLAETDSHWEELRSVVTSGYARGGMVHDARIAAICSEHGVRELWSADRDFSRFPALRVVNPLVG